MPSITFAGTAQDDPYNIEFADKGGGRAQARATNRRTSEQKLFEFSGCRRAANDSRVTGIQASGSANTGFTIEVLKTGPQCKFIITVHQPWAAVVNTTEFTIAAADADKWVKFLSSPECKIPVAVTLRELPQGPEWQASLRAFLTLLPDLREALLSSGWVIENNVLTYGGSVSFTLRSDQTAGTAGGRELRITLPAAFAGGVGL